MGQLKFTIAYESYHMIFVSLLKCGKRREKAGLFVSLKIFSGGSEKKTISTHRKDLMMSNRNVRRTTFVQSRSPARYVSSAFELSLNFSRKFVHV